MDLAIWRRTVPAEVGAALVRWAREWDAFEEDVDAEAIDVSKVLAGLRQVRPECGSWKAFGD